MRHQNPARTQKLALAVEVALERTPPGFAVVVVETPHAWIVDVLPVDHAESVARVIREELEAAGIGGTVDVWEQHVDVEKRALKRSIEQLAKDVSVNVRSDLQKFLS